MKKFSIAYLKKEKKDEGKKSNVAHEKKESASHEKGEHKAVSKLMSILSKAKKAKK